MHGTFNTTRKRHLRGSACKKCTEKERITFKEFVKLAHKSHGEIYEYSENSFKMVSKPMEINCSIHGPFQQKPNNHYRLRHGCPKCSYNISRLETDYLDGLGLPNDTEHRQVRIKITGSKRGFLVDGYDPQTRTVYEFDGDFWHGNPNKYKAEDINPRTKKTFGEHYEQTLFKHEMLRRSGYKVIHIWETEYIANGLP